MIKKILISLFISISLLGCSKQHATFVDTQGNKIDFSALQGKWIFINYWATWCHPCMAEIPQLNQFYQSHKNKVIVLGVNYDSLSNDALNNAIKKLNIHFPVLTQNPEKILSLDESGVVPTTYVFNPQGHLVKTLLGPQTQTSLNNVIKD